MPKTDFPNPARYLTKIEARRFLLAHQHLWPPRALAGKAGILDFIRHVGCIQYDPVNLVGQNPELVLQARVADYTPALFAELLYTDRRLVDGWDKQAAIHLIEDWPYFTRHRERARRDHGDPVNPPMAIAAAVKDAIRERGPLCSADLGHDDTIDWWWGVPTRLGRAALEILYGMGEVGVHHRINTRRYFDLIERLLPADLLAAADPNPTEEAYEDWHVARRVGSLGLANPAAGEYWLGMGGMKAEARRATLARLSAQGVLIPVAVEGIAQAPLFIRSSDVSLLELARKRTRHPARRGVHRPAGQPDLGSRPDPLAVRLRLHLGGVQTGGAAQVRPLRPAGAVWRPLCGPRRADLRPQGAGADDRQLVVGGRRRSGRGDDLRAGRVPGRVSGGTWVRKTCDWVKRPRGIRCCGG